MPRDATVLTPWQAIRGFLLAAGLAVGFALTAAIFAEGNYVRPLCDAYGREHNLRYIGFQYPPRPGTDGRSSCIFSDGSSSFTSVDFARIAPDRRTRLLVDIATTPVVTVPFFVLLFGFGLVGLYGALGIRLPWPRRGGPASGTPP